MTEYQAGAPRTKRRSPGLRRRSAAPRASDQLVAVGEVHALKPDTSLSLCKGERMSPLGHRFTGRQNTATCQDCVALAGT